MKQTIRTITILILLLITYQIQAQERSGMRGGNGKGKDLPAIGQISGQINDTLTGDHIEYATVALYNRKTNDLVSGTITQKNGRFYLEKIKPGKYYLKVSFLGYNEKTLDEIHISPEESIVNLHEILIAPSINNLEEVVIDGSTPRIDYQIDKKVINVSKQITSISGTAVDVLENVPSVKVDIEGNVSLRGSSGFSVLIDGRPSVLDPNDALQQIPASSIDNIEIITNPSAKYDPDGTAGIINIITKKNKLQGLSGIVNANVGLDEKYGGDVLVNYRKRNVNVFLGLDYDHGNHPGDSYNERFTYVGDTIYKTIMYGDNNRSRQRWGIRSGFDYTIGNNDIVGVGFRFGDRRMNSNSESDYNESIDPGGISNIYSNMDFSKRGGYFYDLTGNYQHKFEKKGHELKADFSLAQRNFEDNSTNELTDEFGVVVDGKKNIETGPSGRIRGKIDYTLPIGEKDKFEAGYQFRYSKSEDQTGLLILNPDNGIYETQAEYTNVTNYIRNIHSIYSLYAGEIGKLGYQGGVRGEYTYRDIVSGNDQFGIDRWDFFPTVHLSYQLPKEHQLMASYTRRIERSRGWYLEPFITWSDAFNVRRGNPNLLPEYIDSYEMGYLKKIGQNNLISLEGYYRITNNKVERVRSVYEGNIMLSEPENVGKDYALGLEFMFSFQLYKWWEVDLLGDLYNYKVEGVLYGEDFSNKSNNWSSRLNQTFKIKKSTSIQINTMYNGPSVTAQGKEEGSFMVNAAVRQDFMDRKLSLVLQARDLFLTAKRESTTSGPDFYYYSEFKRRNPMISLSVSYRFNNYKQDKRGSGLNGDSGGDMEEM